MSFRTLKKIFLYTALAVILLFAAAVAVVYTHQDEVIQLVVRELNKNLLTKVEVNKIELSLFEKFPRVALRFGQLTVQSSLPEQTQPLAKAEKLYLTFDFWDVVGGTYKISEVFLENADVQIYVDKQGNENFRVYRSSGPGGSGSKVDVNLRNIHLKQVNVVYTDVGNDQTYALFARQSDASLRMQADDLFITLQGALQSKKIQLGNYKYFTNKDLAITSELVYNLDKRKLTIEPSTLRVNRSEFTVQGTYEERSQGKVDLQMRGKNADVQTLLSLLPEQYTRQLSAYRSRGNVYFNGGVKGATAKGAIPAISVQFGCENASFYQADIDKHVENAYLKGSYTNGASHNRATSEIRLTNVKGVLEGKPFRGNLVVKNLDNPYLTFDVKGELDAASLLAFYPVKEISSAAGTLAVNVDFEGKLSDLRTGAVNRFVRTSGSVQLDSLSMQLAARPLAFRELTGDFTFNQSDLLVNNFSGKAGHSDFRLDGSFTNVMAYLFFKDQPLQIKADFRSQLLDFDELLAANPTKEKPSVQLVASQPQEEQYQFAISPRLSVDVTCQVSQVRFRRFRANGIRGDLQVASQVASSRSIQIQTAGGNIQLNGTVDARQPDRIGVTCEADFHQLAIDSVFYMFENFSQSFIQDRHLRGSVTAAVQASMQFNRQLDMDLPSLTANVQTSIANGGLLNFEPMQQLSRFIQAEELANLRFSEMQNNFRIERQTVFMPKMEIRSNVAAISVQGSHTFDQVMDYRLQLPVRYLTSRRARATALSSEGDGSNLFLRVTGTSDTYKIAYDKVAVKEKIREDWREEKQEIKTLFKPDKARKPADKPRAAETEEEYFDWDN